MSEKNIYQWNVLKTIPGCEKKVSFYFSHKHIEHYCPFVDVDNKLMKKKNNSIPLFPSYIFTYVDEGLLAKALKVKGVVNCMYWLNKPAVISANEIKVIRQLVLENDSLWLQQIAVDLQANVEITITPKNLYDTKNSISTVHHLRVTLPSLGYCLFGEISHSVQLFKVGCDHVA